MFIKEFQSMSLTVEYIRIDYFIQIMLDVIWSAFEILSNCTSCNAEVIQLTKSYISRMVEK